MVVQCIIEFDNNPAGAYYGGQFVTGSVTLEVDKPKQIKGVALKVIGNAHTAWSESSTHHHNNQTHTKSTHYSGDEKYISTKTFLVGTPNSEAFNLEVGQHRYRFSCHVPSTCPSSFESINGYIRYRIKVILIRPWKFDQTFTKGFTVLKMLDLNYQPMLAMPTHTEVSKKFGIFKSEPLNIKVDLPQSGYVPGQKIPVQVLISNESNSAVQCLKLRLVMDAMLYTDSPHCHTRQHRQTVSKLRGDPVMRNSKALFLYELPVPPVPSTDNEFCRIIKINYIVEVEAKMPTFRPNQTLCIPVTIGNVPLMRNLPQSQVQIGWNPAVSMPAYPQPQVQVGWSPAGSMPAYPQLAVATVVLPGAEGEQTSIQPEIGKQLEAEQEAAAIPPPVTSIPLVSPINMPPPTYEEATYMPQGKINDDEKHDYGDSVFIPRYPVFNVPSPTIDGSEPPLFNNPAGESK